MCHVPCRDVDSLSLSLSHTDNTLSLSLSLSLSTQSSVGETLAAHVQQDKLGKALKDAVTHQLGGNDQLPAPTESAV